MDGMSEQMSVAMMSQPAAASASQCDRPWPRAAPVTSATLPVSGAAAVVSFVNFCSILVWVSRGGTLCRPHVSGQVAEPVGEYATFGEQPDAAATREGVLVAPLEDDVGLCSVDRLVDDHVRSRDRRPPVLVEVDADVAH